MRNIIEKLFLALASFSLMISQKSDVEGIGLLLLFLILSLSLDLVSKPWLHYFLLTAQLVLLFFFPQGLFFLPIFIYCSYQVVNHLAWFSLIFLLFKPWPLLICLTLLAAYLAYQTEEERRFKVQSLTIQDRLSEDKMSLRRKQQQLEQDQVKNLEIATLSERNRIAHTLHDSIGHLISSSILQLEALQITTKEITTQKQLELLSEHLQEGMTDIRQTLHQLYNESFDLRQRIEESLEPLSNRELTFHYWIESDLPLSVKLDFVTIVKELVTNCCKHSNSSQVKLVLVEQPSFYSLTYQDNGTMISKGQKGIGIYSIEEIVHKYQGNVSIDQDKGYRIHLIFRKEAIDE